METPLDELYGAGVAAEFTRRMTLAVGEAIGVGAEAHVTEQIVNGTFPSDVSVEVTWMKGTELIGYYRLIYKGSEVETTGLWIEPAFTGKGILLNLCEQLNEWWATLGIVRNTMTPTPGRAQEALEACGFTNLGDAWGTHIPSPQLIAAVARLRKLKKPPPVF